MNQAKFFGGLILIAVILTGVWLVFGENPSQNENEQPASSALVSQGLAEAEPALAGPQEEPLTSALLIVNTGLADPEAFALDVSEETTAFSLLRASGLELSFQDYEGMGMLIEAIGQQKNGDDNKYWLYYLNGEMPMLSVDQQLISPGDIIEFRFEESVF